MRSISILTLLMILFSCKQEVKVSTNTSQETISTQNIEYASGFTIQNHEGYKEINVSSPWPDAKTGFTYILYPKGTSKPIENSDAIFIEVPVEKVVVTSTTDIPILEYLNVEKALAGFPNTDFISSEKTRKLIDNGSVKELGSEHKLNTEVVLELAPDLIVGFSATGDTKTYDLIQKTGIPVVMNGSWTEQHPLGRAEWVKFIAAFFGKETEADIIFQNIEKDYNNALKLAKKATSSPTVLSGNMYKDVWYVPGGASYVAKFLKDANTIYLWANTDKTGSLNLNFESVLEKAQNADLWIGSGNSTSLATLQEKNNKYELFNAFKNKAVYSSTLKIGPKGGLIYYELGPMRPDLILKDIIQIAHPELLTDYEPYFFEKLN
ncbi:ABC transporter substrate-binding protein [Aquimarina sp. 2201CG5-10]|uniref:ABC transporter substrate-binding protein n=1 Tax=Aquimarina callyspongiae TaxID=3098150 RepID=UPI002AB42773|nr:ABC transporter substrate-binding protein [Aquimarina sp. 2201CG5-10]MDY8138887.1 ABC transporter substrate-binding protein [Aquimarina sp. 2201CG5-10]